MKRDGSGKCRLSGFNSAGAPEYIGVEGGIGLGDFSVGPDGKTIVGKMRCGPKEAVVVLIEFDFKIVSFGIRLYILPSYHYRDVITSHLSNLILLPRVNLFFVGSELGVSNIDK